ncbi:MAG: response regulator [Nannocystis sp.]|nr:ATP-binding protein [Nannocystis sp.]MBA3549034.1 response regulator [Nannocystis sp.]
MTDTLEHLYREIDELHRQLAEARETIRAIQGGEVDAVVVTDDVLPRVLMLDSADKPFQLLVERMHQGAATLTVDGSILYCNEQFSRLLRVPHDSLRGRPMQELIDGPSLPLFEALLRDGLAASVEGEIVLRRADDSWIPLYLGVSALHEGVGDVWLLVADLTEQKRRERLVADSAMARSVLEQVGDAVIVCDINGIVLRASRSAHALCGTNPLLKPFDEVFWLSPLSPESVDGELFDVGAAWRGETLRGWEVGFNRRGGERAELLLNAGPLVAAGGEMLGAVITLTDITALREAQDELHRRANALQEADRRKDEFLAMLAHELRNPLAPIRASLEIMKLRGHDDPMLRKCRDIIERQTHQLTRLVDDLLEVSRIRTGKIQLRTERVSLAVAVARGIETSRPVSDAKGHHLTLAVPDAPIWVKADLTRISQVVGNLINNAAKYTDDGGQISVRVAQDGTMGVIHVRDSGIGIPREMLATVFDLFTQVTDCIDRSQGGLGIGLALVKQLVVMHGGQVEARSDGPGRGSEFIVRLPLWAEDRAALVADVKPGSGTSRRVLVVDDNQDAVDILADLLGMLGHDVRTACSGPAAITVATEFVPDIMLCDIGLPLMDGYEVVAELRARPEFAKTRFIALTGYGRDEDRQRSHAAGFHAHLVKPFDLAKLVALLDPA